MADRSAPVSPEATHVSGRRYLAHALDGVLITIALVVLIVPAAIFSNTILAIVIVLWLVFGQFAYYVLTQRGSGRSPGKRAFGIRIVDEHGGTPSTEALVKRTIPLILEYLYVIAFFSMMASPYRQRLGDRWARTYVVVDDRGRADA
jgi:uncharacterized RDD family membrane protein YckC